MWDRTKQILAFVLLVVSGAFFFERSRRKSAEAIVDNQEVKDKVVELDKQKASNDGQLESEEVKRADIQKEADAKKADNSDDAVDFLKRR